jgi:hypothetical protein
MAKITVVVGEPPYGKERIYSTLRFVLAALHEGHSVNLFLLEDSVFVPKKGQKPAEIPFLLFRAFPPVNSVTRKQKTRQRPTLPPRLQGSTIGAGGLNCRVRNGNGCFPSAIATGIISQKSPRSSKPDAPSTSFAGHNKSLVSNRSPRTRQLLTAWKCNRNR